MKRMEESIFTKIVRGEIPCHKIYEDEHTLAFLDIHPLQPGHTLIIPKRQVQFVWDLNPALYQALMTTTQKVALRLREIMPQPLVGEHIVGTDVPHAHVHLVPFTESSDLKRAQDLDSEPDHAALAELAKKLAF